VLDIETSHSPIHGGSRKTFLSAPKYISPTS
jgi:hypothetical protein